MKPRWLLSLSLCFLSAAPARAALKLVPVVSGLVNPVYVTVAPDNDQRLYVVLQEGKIVTVDNGKVNDVPFLDISDKVTSGGEMGLLGLVFHPQFKTNGRYFINYTVEDPSRRSIIAEYHLGVPTEKVLLTYSQPFTNHKGGMLAFDKEGYLYIGTGDGGSGGDPYGNGQNKDAILAKMLRIDVDHGDPYAIPADNPFAQGGGRKEIFAWGLRNPWRFSFDRVTGALFAGDVGQDLWEEIDIVEKGKNYGWNIMEATHCYSPQTGCERAGLTLPIFEYGHGADGNCIIGGYVYRGSAIPELQGVYLFGDNGSGKIWGLRYDQDEGRTEGRDLLLSSQLAISSFGQDNQGELFVIDYNSGTVFRIVKDGGRR